MLRGQKSRCGRSVVWAERDDFRKPVHLDPTSSLFKHLAPFALCAAGQCTLRIKTYIMGRIMSIGIWSEHQGESRPQRLRARIERRPALASSTPQNLTRPALPYASSPRSPPPPLLARHAGNARRLPLRRPESEPGGRICLTAMRATSEAGAKKAPSSGGPWHPRRSQPRLWFAESRPTSPGRMWGDSSSGDIDRADALERRSPKRKSGIRPRARTRNGATSTQCAKSGTGPNDVLGTIDIGADAKTAAGRAPIFVQIRAFNAHVRRAKARSECGPRSPT